MTLFPVFEEGATHSVQAMRDLINFIHAVLKFLGDNQATDAEGDTCAEGTSSCMVPPVPEETPPQTGTGTQDTQSSSRTSTSVSAITKVKHTSTASVMTSAKEEMVRMSQEEHKLRMTLLTTQIKSAKEEHEATMELLAMKKELLQRKLNKIERKDKRKGKGKGGKGKGKVESNN